jgi:hypothetical protein
MTARAPLLIDFHPGQQPSAASTLRDGWRTLSIGERFRKAILSDWSSDRSLGSEYTNVKQPGSRVADVRHMKTLWVVEPYDDGTCRVYRVTTRTDGSCEVGEPFWHWTTMVLDGHPAYHAAKLEEDAFPRTKPAASDDPMQRGVTTYADRKG